MPGRTCSCLTLATATPTGGRAHSSLEHRQPLWVTSTLLTSALLQSHRPAFHSVTGKKTYFNGQSPSPSAQCCIHCGQGHREALGTRKELGDHPSLLLRRPGQHTPGTCHTLDGQLRRNTPDSSDCGPPHSSSPTRSCQHSGHSCQHSGGPCEPHPPFPGSENRFGLCVHPPRTAMSSDQVTLTPGQRKAPELIMNNLPPGH